MCAGAIVNARLDRVIFGAEDPKGGAFGGLFDLREYPLGCRTQVAGGVLADEAKGLLGSFFVSRREMQKTAAEKKVRLGRDFYLEHADRVAPALLGKILCKKDRETGEITRVRITETECYLGENDTACHASKGKTDRSRVLWDKGGTIYVYLCYGMHNMLNVVTGAKGEPEAVLIRGTEDLAEEKLPEEKLPEKKWADKQLVKEKLATEKLAQGEKSIGERHDGPGRVTKHLGIDRKLNGGDFVLSDELWIESDGTPAPEFDTTPRIGIDYATEEDRQRPWRYVIRRV